MGAKSELFLLDGYRHGFINAARQGNLQFEDLLDNGRPAAEGAATARRFAGADDDGTPARFGFDDIAGFFARHLGVTSSAQAVARSRK